MPYIDVAVAHDPDSELATRLARGISELTSRVLGRVFEHTAVAIRFVPPAYWFLAGRPLSELGVSSFWLDVKVTSGTTQTEQRARYLAEITAFMREQLGELHEVSYLRVDETAGDGWGFGGISQEERRLRRAG